ncbi:MAG: MMPL family transporter [Myxococcales bacterium]|nr:MMPL family transporter [Myxococcales bacterium]
MMERLARALARRGVAMAVVGLVLATVAVCAPYAAQVRRDDDILAFLPKDNPEIAEFRRINEVFGGLDVGIVGIEVDDPFDGAFLDRLAALTKELNEKKEIAYALSLANVDDFAADPDGGVRTDYLVSEIPRSDEARAALRAKVMGKAHIVGNLVSKDEKAVNLYCFLRHGTDLRTAADLVRTTVSAALPDLPRYWGGAPFMSTYIYDMSLTDMKTLMPWALVIVLVVVLVSFRHWMGALLALFSTVVSIAVAYGAMGIANVQANIVLSSMPVILFAIGTGYPINILSHYYELARTGDKTQALVQTMVEFGPPVIIGALTTVAGLLAFVVMDIGPIRTFGLFSALGVLTSLVLALTFIPAVISLTKMRGHPPGRDRLGELMGRFAGLVPPRRRWIAVAVGLVAAGSALCVGQVDARMENAAFFAKGSPPDRAEAFLRDHFGGSQFIQIEVRGDMNSPEVLREVSRLADELAVLPHVSDVNHVGLVLSLANEAWVGERRIPLDEGQVRGLYGLLKGKHTVGLVVTDDRTAALLHVKLDSDRIDDVEQLLAAVEAMMRHDVVTSYALGKRDGPRRTEVEARNHALVTARIEALARAEGLPLGADARAKLGALFGGGAAAYEPKRVEERLATFLRSDESMLDEEELEQAGPLAAAVAALGPDPSEPKMRAAIAATLGLEPDSKAATAVYKSLVTAARENWRQEKARALTAGALAAAGVPAAEGEAGARLRARFADALLDLERDSALLPVVDGGAPDGTLTVTVSGQPVLNRGLSNSVTSNQLWSVVSSLAMVLLLMLVLFRSLWASILGLLPCMITLAIVYGAMGLFRIHLDIGTSMLANIIVGTGVDFGVYLLAGWRAKNGEGLGAAAARSAVANGTAIWTNVATVGGGFFVLTLGHAKPLQSFGGLTAAAMLTAGLATFVVIPALAHKRQYLFVKDAGPAPQGGRPPGRDADDAGAGGGPSGREADEDDDSLPAAARVRRG